MLLFHSHHSSKPLDELNSILSFQFFLAGKGEGSFVSGLGGQVGVINEEGDC